MKKVIAVCLILSFSLSTFSQGPQSVIDSLLLRIDTMDAKGKVGAHIEIATHYQFLPGGFDSTTVHAQRALEISEKQDFAGGMQMAYYYLGMAAWYGKEDFDLAKSYFHKVKEMMVKNNNIEQAYQIDNAIGTLEIMEGNYEDALTILQNAYYEAEKYGDYDILSIISTNLGIIYNSTNDTLNAIKINESALGHVEKSTTPDKEITRVGILTNLADLYLRTGQLEKMQDVLKKARIKTDSMKMFRLEARLAIAEVKYMDKIGEKEKLYAYVNTKLPLFEKNVGYDRAMYSSLLYYKGRGHAEKGEVKETKKIIQKLKSYLGTTNMTHEENLLQRIYDLSGIIGEYEDAYKYLDRYKILSDSLLDAKQKEKILALDRKYELEKKENEIERKKVENLNLKRNNSLLISGILGLALIGLLSYLWYYRRRQQEAAKINQIEQKMLSLQMNPHFIFNAISSIQNYLFDEGDANKAIRHLSTFATLMRQMLENSRERFIPLEEEVEFLQNYLDLQKLRFDDKFTYEINISEDIDPTTLSIPPLLTQPFIENAIDHGKIYLVEKGLLKINIFKHIGDLVIQIVDNGVGIDNDRKNDDKDKPLIIKKKSLSIAITNERLHLLSKLMKKKFHLEVKPNEAGRGTTVNLNVPSVSLD